MDIIVSNIITLVSLLVGYFIGRYTPTHTQVFDQIKAVSKKLDRSPVGVVYNPTQADILKRTDPKEIRLEEEKEAMRETLKNIVERG